MLSVLVLFLQELEVQDPFMVFIGDGLLKKMDLFISCIIDVFVVLRDLENLQLQNFYD